MWARFDSPSWSTLDRARGMGSDAPSPSPALWFSWKTRGEGKTDRKRREAERRTLASCGALPLLPIAPSKPDTTQRHGGLQTPRIVSTWYNQGAPTMPCVYIAAASREPEPLDHGTPTRPITWATTWLRATPSTKLCLRNRAVAASGQAKNAGAPGTHFLRSGIAVDARPSAESRHSHSERTVGGLPSATHEPLAMIGAASRTTGWSRRNERSHMC